MSEFPDFLGGIVADIRAEATRLLRAADELEEINGEQRARGPKRTRKRPTIDRLAVVRRQGPPSAQEIEEAERLAQPRPRRGSVEDQLEDEAREDGIRESVRLELGTGVQPTPPREGTELVHTTQAGEQEAPVERRRFGA